MENLPKGKYRIVIPHKADSKPGRITGLHYYPLHKIIKICNNATRFAIVYNINEKLLHQYNYAMLYLDMRNSKNLQMLAKITEVSKRDNASYTDWFGGNSIYDERKVINNLS
ncbi:Replication factor C subunit 2 [Eufriesea mexicana]|uniref:Replication factor C subunit 2 n=1 Tax=Eufriesea mexicana TaxID=516756 RepID=A0A310SKG2_9HYME|nr:Replication factor C subunit 2 [Eufriesea mexicana]